MHFTRLCLYKIFILGWREILLNLPKFLNEYFYKIFQKFLLYNWTCHFVADAFYIIILYYEVYLAFLSWVFVCFIGQRLRLSSYRNATPVLREIFIPKFCTLSSTSLIFSPTVKCHIRNIISWNPCIIYC